jgi:hypothetical protein
MSIPYISLLIGLLVVGIALLFLRRPEQPPMPFKQVETNQSLVHERQETVSQDVDRLAKQDTMKEGESLLVLEAEITPDSRVTKLSPDRSPKEESSEEAVIGRAPQSQGGHEISATGPWMVKEADRATAQVAKESEGVHVRFSGDGSLEAQIDTGESIRDDEDLDPLDSLPKADSLKKEEDIHLEVETTMGEHFSSPAETVVLDSWVKTEGLDRGLLKESPQGSSTASLVESEVAEIQEDRETASLEEDLSESRFEESLLEEDRGPKTSVEVANQEIWQKDRVLAEASARKVGREGSSKRRVGGAPTDDLTDAVETTVLPEIDKPSPEDSRKAALGRRIMEGADPAKAEHKDVKEFLAEYMDRYNTKDIKGFLSLFSPRAIQNGKDDIKEIEKVYSGFFDQSQELQYQIENTRVQINRNVSISGDFFEIAAEVKARYRIDQVSKKGRERKVWRGDIVWTLVKENEHLRVRKLDYEQKKSPRRITKKVNETQ